VAKRELSKANFEQKYSSVGYPTMDKIADNGGDIFLFILSFFITVRHILDEFSPTIN